MRAEGLPRNKTSSTKRGRNYKAGYFFRRSSLRNAKKRACETWASKIATIALRCPRVKGFSPSLGLQENKLWLPGLVPFSAPLSFGVAKPCFYPCLKEGLWQKRQKWRLCSLQRRTRALLLRLRENVTRAKKRHGLQKALFGSSLNLCANSVLATMALSVYLFKIQIRDLLKLAFLTLAPWWELKWKDESKVGLKCNVNFTEGTNAPHGNLNQIEMVAEIKDIEFKHWISSREVVYTRG